MAGLDDGSYFQAFAEDSSHSFALENSAQRSFAEAAIADRADAAQVWSARIASGRRLLREMFGENDIDNADEFNGRTVRESDADANRAAVLVAPCEGARSLLITFGGNAGYLLLMPPVREMPRTHVIAIRDPKRCFAMCGVAGLGDTYEKCIDAFRRLIWRLGATRVHCFGASAGGYSALRYGLDLRADGVLAMSAPTTLNLADDPGATLARYPYLTALYRRRPEIGVDLVRLYRNSLPRPEVLLLYAPSHELDNWLANRMRGLHGVTLEETGLKAGHRVLQCMNQADGLQPYLARLRNMRPIES